MAFTGSMSTPLMCAPTLCAETTATWAVSGTGAGAASSTSTASGLASLSMEGLLRGYCDLSTAPPTGTGTLSFASVSYRLRDVGWWQSAAGTYAFTAVATGPNGRNATLVGTWKTVHNSSNACLIGSSPNWAITGSLELIGG
ncbi:MAG: hypothetical protein M3394_06190 [Actinomycetota bacterium]|nr:hypothetical protein [Actinomycetota bacterium]